MVCKACPRRWGEDPSTSLVSLVGPLLKASWDLQRNGESDSHSSAATSALYAASHILPQRPLPRHSFGCVNLPQLDVLDFKDTGAYEMVHLGFRVVLDGKKG